VTYGQSSYQLGQDFRAALGTATVRERSRRCPTAPSRSRYQERERERSRRCPTAPSRSRYQERERERSRRCPTAPSRSRYQERERERIPAFFGSGYAGLGREISPRLGNGEDGF